MISNIVFIIILQNLIDVLPILMAFCFAYIFIIFAIVMCSVELKTRQMLHSTYKLFVVSVALQESGIILQSLAYVKYAINGKGSSSTKVFGQFYNTNLFFINIFSCV